VPVEVSAAERKQDRSALLDPAGRRSLISPFRSSRKCRMCVEAGVSFRWIRVPRFLNTRYAGDAGADFRSAPTKCLLIGRWRASRATRRAILERMQKRAGCRCVLLLSSKTSVPETRSGPVGN